MKADAASLLEQALDAYGQRAWADAVALFQATDVIWCTGFRAGLDWIKLPIFDETGQVKQYRGTVEGEPGLYVCGLHFQHSPSSTMIHGSARDAGYVADKIAERIRAATSQGLRAALEVFAGN